MAMIMPCACLAAGGKNRRGNAHCLSACVLASPLAERTGAETCTVFCLECLPRRWRENRRGNAHRLSARVLPSPLAGKPAGRAEPSAFPTNAPYMWKKEQSRDKERRRAREKGTGFVRKKGDQKSPGGTSRGSRLFYLYMGVHLVFSTPTPGNL